jgi:hypothetical protein
LQPVNANVRPRMSLTPTIKHIAALYRKLQREEYRTLHCRVATHRADHFLNFCVTAHSMKDHLLEHLRSTGTPDPSSLHQRWNQYPSIVAAGDIANSAKHFVLRDRKTKQPITPQTKAVRPGRSRYLDFYQLPSGELTTQEVHIPDYFVRLSNGTRHDLYSFMHEVLVFWKQELQSHGIRLSRQSFASLSGKQKESA